jgi:hypothetical protein
VAETRVAYQAANAADLDPFAGEVFDPTGEVARAPLPTSTANGRGGGDQARFSPDQTSQPPSPNPPPPRPNGNGNGPATPEMIWEDRPALKRPERNGDPLPKTMAVRPTSGGAAPEPREPREPRADATPQRIVIRLNAAGDKLLLRRVYDVLISHPGQDHFTLFVTETNGQQYALDFYNESTTHFCGELIDRLLKFVSSDAIEVLPLTR